MNRQQNFIAIFAIALMALGTSLLFSCNADDEEYDFNGVYTMANGVKTRSAEGGQNQNITTSSDSTYTKYTFNFKRKYPQSGHLNNPVLYSAEIDVCIYKKNGKPAVEMLSYLPSYLQFSVTEVMFVPAEENLNSYKLCAVGFDDEHVEFIGEVWYRYFF